MRNAPGTIGLAAIALMVLGCNRDIPKGGVSKSQPSSISGKGSRGGFRAALTDLRGICAAPMPSGFGWPDDPNHLYQISGGIKTDGLSVAGTIDTPAQRQHGWKLFQAVTSPSDPANPESLPVFHTWYSVEETFDPTDGKLTCAARQPLMTLELPTQLLLGTSNPTGEALRKIGLSPSVRFDPDPRLVRQANGKMLVAAHDGVVAFSHVAFDQEMYDFIRDNKYYSRDVLNAKVDSSQSRLPIQDPPIRGVSLKLSWWPASPDQITPVPVWDNDPRSPGDGKNPPTTWKRVVVVDPTGNHPAPATVQLGGFTYTNPKVVGLDRFYSVVVSADEATAANSDFRIKQAAVAVLGRPLQEGDYLLLTAMHIATREFDPWVFTTYWWHDNADVGPFATDKPTQLSGPWRNYLMDVSYNINRPMTPDGLAPIAFSPWLELFQVGGLRSQCMACHARAAFGNGVSASYNPKTSGTTDPNGFEASPNGAQDPAFQKGTLSLHRIWTIFTRAQ